MTCDALSKYRYEALVLVWCCMEHEGLSSWSKIRALRGVSPVQVADWPCAR